MRTSVAVLVVGLVAVPLAAAAAPTTISVQLSAKAVVLSRAEVPVGTVRFAVVNVGAKPNRFAINGKRTRLLKKRERATLVVEFAKAGSYRANALGSTRILRVTEPEPEPEPVAKLTILGSFAMPTDIDAPPHSTRRLFVVEQAGLVHLLVNNVRLATPFLDLRDRVDATGEAGLLSIAFAPDYATSGRFYVYYNDRAQNLHLVEYRRAADNPELADPESARELLYQIKFAPNHNGGMLQFGPDGRLYVAVGDGGSSAVYKPGAFAQKPDAVFGKILSLVPETGEWSVWASGLRNAWRFWIDAQSGDTFVADVGQERREEIDVVPAGQSGLNFGWPCLEGTLVFDEAETCENVTAPLYEYAHGAGACSITGGVVVHDRRLPALAGAYLFGDFCGDWIRALRRFEAGFSVGDVGVEASQPISFGQDGRGRVYIGSATGTVWRLDPPG
ncbi:MAG TPA: PQQ-dependent sugar dehydrogenase [Gaiellaceae bacterium]|nr:PQQ-dependent sugar dehydrogenase [Gaiellaceae bacterium]